jgi:hypothetical protein
MQGNNIEPRIPWEYTPAFGKRQCLLSLETVSVPRELLKRNRE